jgi:glucosyl-3-phosphoglycerate synthase
MNKEVDMSTYESVRTLLPSPSVLYRRLKQDQRISLCIPARNEAATIGPLLKSFYEHRVWTEHLIDEIIVIDDRSSDATAQIASTAGATVWGSSEWMGRFGPSRGKGDALWRSVAASTGEIIVWCDADLTDADPALVWELVRPMLLDPELLLVKGYFDRNATGAIGGGRVTELAARPLLAALFPELCGIRQPLSGMTAIRRSAAEALSFEADYGVDVGLLIGVYQRFGVDAIGEAELGVVAHRHRPLHELGPMAASVQRTILRRAGVAVQPSVLQAPVRPALETVPGYGRVRHRQLRRPA